MKVTFFFIILLLTFISCGQGSPKSAKETQIGQSLLEDGLLTGAEKNTALRICYAFRSKNTYFRANLTDTNFNFKLTHTNCSGNNSDQTINATLKAPYLSEAMIYDSAAQNPYRKVQTDQHGALKDICSSILSGAEPSKTYKSGSQLVSTSFSSGATDVFTIRIADLIGSTYTVSSEEMFEVKTGVSVENKLGMITKVTRRQSCFNSKIDTMILNYLP